MGCGASLPTADMLVAQPADPKPMCDAGGKPLTLVADGVSQHLSISPPFWKSGSSTELTLTLDNTNKFQVKALPPGLAEAGRRGNASSHALRSVVTPIRASDGTLVAVVGPLLHPRDGIGLLHLADKKNQACEVYSVGPRFAGQVPVDTVKMASDAKAAFTEAYTKAGMMAKSHMRLNYGTAGVVVGIEDHAVKDAATAAEALAAFIQKEGCTFYLWSTVTDTQVHLSSAETTVTEASLTIKGISNATFSTTFSTPNTALVAIRHVPKDTPSQESYVVAPGIDAMGLVAASLASFLPAFYLIAQSG